ncbi:hypothetical protein IE81DRAFT_181814 [Ceraceosorus guamensis]|uniref:Uncharacterized protein n=1 Tax=Ceraceosorus guamensis TaxID=1522189 RepID=A0A316W0P5_9BASI|nr:hypothetical protein IE81DRAFT_181814 [Ceraceosorus guamensis]PWN41245.1 hypothetical protein IE81DRAFT_181814 [Ceraceosorus guamensis]
MSWSRHDLRAVHRAYIASGQELGWGENNGHDLAGLMGDDACLNTFCEAAHVPPPSHQSLLATALSKHSPRPSCFECRSAFSFWGTPLLFQGGALQTTAFAVQTRKRPHVALAGSRLAIQPESTLGAARPTAPVHARGVR